MKLTSHAGEQLTSKVLDLTAGERDKSIALQEVEHALTQQIRDNAYMVSVVETVPEMDTFVAVAFIV